MFGTTPKDLKSCNTVEGLAHLLGTDYNSLGKLLYGKKTLYRAFDIVKKSGGVREITTPIPSLKVLQRKLKDLIEPFTSHREAAHGFIRKRGVLTNATRHVGKKHVLNTDLEDFFGTINFGRVKRLFESSPFELSSQVATVLAQIVCYKNRLPQGAPTSPIISNMIAFKLDGNLTSLARKAKSTYTRYADDLTFSCHSSMLLEKNGIIKFDKDNKAIAGKELVAIIKSNGFEINHQKTRLQSRGSHQGVTGITVNEKPNVSRTFIRKTSSILYAINRWGAEQAEEEHFAKYRRGYSPPRAQLRRKKKPGDLILKMVKGQVNYNRMIRGESCPVYRKLAYQLTIALGCPNEDLNKDWRSWIAESTFIVDNVEDICQGSCVLIKDIGFVSNQHVLNSITKSNFTANVTICDPYDYSRKYPLISLLKMSIEKDIALIDAGVHALSLRGLEVAESPNYKIGTKVIAIGFPNHTEGTPPTILDCKIIGRTKWHHEPRIKVDSNIHHGFSGGAVVDLDGKVIGIVANGTAVGAPKAADNLFIPIETVAQYA
ncbi:reverse transcriptase domain-containing protein [Alteromonas confluentis]|uniref:reverse transcriptase domain-containing protein n=1 Tax=Alteromonas confluentis TaxID=1656094 RepID=UPI0009F5FC69|nr:reverse transcriptase domain-containing protein [Alteromonas confluentis]